MSQKYLVIVRDQEERSILLKGEKIIIGRDKNCDVVLDHESVSRKHAALVYKFDTVYIENISSTGRVSRADEAIEHCELAEHEEITIGPYTLFWQSSLPKNNSSSNVTPDGESAPGDKTLVKAEEVANFDSASVNLDSQNQPQISAIDAPSEPPLEENPPQDHAFQVINQNEQSDGNTSTAIVKGSIYPVLKVIKGEVIGREIKLDHGLTWTVGRSPKCQVQIDCPKLSRQHFRIVKIGQAYRVQDIDSAYGTRLNGVAVTDAPLQPFDTLQAGPVEIQFTIIDSANLGPGASAMASPLMLDHSSSFGESPSANASEHTQFAPPVVYSGVDAFSSGAYGNSSTPGPQLGDTNASKVGNSSLKERFENIGPWFAAQPPAKKALYAALACLTIILGALLLLPTAPKNNSKDTALAVANAEGENRQPASVPNLAEPNAADPRDVSPEFNLLSTEKQNEIRDLYAKAERAKSAKDWQTAFDSAKGIFDRKIKRYKKAADIMDEAQTYLNEGTIGTISKSMQTVQEADRDNQERIKILMDNGEKAIKEGRWNDAEESYLKAMAIDPSNERATRGYAAAKAKDANILVSETVVENPIVSAEQGDIQQEHDEIDSYKQFYQDAKSRMQNGNFREALPILKGLDKKLSERIDQYESGQRGPASVRNDLKMETKILQSRVKEAIETSQAQLRASFATQLADADQLINNTQYAEDR